MIYLNKHQEYEYWLYSSAGDVYACEETGDGLLWYDARGWDLDSERFCEKLTNARTEALLKMPKRVEFETEMKVEGKNSYFKYTKKEIYEMFVKVFQGNHKVKVIIEEVKK